MMNNTEYYTPQKLNSTSFINRNLNSNNNSPLNFQASYQFTPSSNSSTLSTSTRKPTTTAGSFHLLPFINTPPSRLKKVINPFEHALTERLHLPLICSPSLFKPPSTPKKNDSLSQFEWTIDDVSSLKPANVEPHETQFENSPDPELEAKAQAAIRSYFKEQLIVPSPIECPLRNRRIILNEKSKILTSSTKAIKSSVIMASSSSSSATSLLVSTSSLKKKSRNVITQTMLSFPPKLPNEVEKILKKYLISNKTETENESTNEIVLDESVVIVDCNNSYNQSDCESSREVSRKLFDSSIMSPRKNHNNANDADIVTTPKKNRSSLTCDNISPSPMKTPELDIEPLNTKNSGDLNDVSFCTISPISKLGSPSPLPILSTPSSTSSLCNLSLHKTAIASSPLSILYRNTLNQSLYKSAKDDINDITIPANMSIDTSFTNDIEQHQQQQQQQVQDFNYCSNKQNNMNNSKNICNGDTNKILKSKSFAEIKHVNDNDDEVMQISLLSSSVNVSMVSDLTNDIIIGSSSSPSSLSTSQRHHPDTPIKRRYPSRKNLSHSFSYHLNDDNDYDEDDNDNNDNVTSNNDDDNDNDDDDDNTYNEQNNKEIIKENQIITLDYNDYDKSKFYSTDSGFNEITQSTQVDESKFTNDLKIRCGISLNNDNKMNNILFDQNNILLSNDISMIDTTIDLPQTKGSIKNNSSPMRCCSTPSSKRANLNFF